MKSETYVIELDDWNRRLLVSCINTARNMFLEEKKPIEDVCELLRHVIEAPTKKKKRKPDREAR